MFKKWVFFTVATMLFAAPASAAGDRFGAVSGTWGACVEGVKTIEERIAILDKTENTPTQWLHHLKLRLVVELDKCARSADTPGNDLLEIISKYEDLGLSDRALSFSLMAIERMGATADLNLVVGRLFYKRGMIDRALPYLLAVVDERPTDVDAHELLGAHYYQQGQFAEAVTHLRFVVRDRSEQFEANAALGDTCLRLGDLNCAGEYLNRASRLKSDDVLLAVKVGQLNLANSQFGEAIEAYDRALLREPDRVDALLGLGRAAKGAGLLEAAQSRFLEAVKVAPKDPIPALEASRVLRALDRASPSLLLPFSTDGGVEARVEYMLARLALGQFGQALAYVKGLPEGLTVDDRIAAVMGDVLLSTGSAKEALSRYQQALTARPQALPYVVRVARALRNLDKVSEAIDLLQTNASSGDASVNKELVSSLLDQAREKARQNNLNEADTLLVRAAVIAPEDESVRTAHAAVLAAAGQTAQALEKAKGVSPGAARSGVESWIAYRAGKFADAAKLAGDLYEAKKSPSMQLLTGAALLGMGEPTRALEVLNVKTKGGDVPMNEWRGQALALVAKKAIQEKRFEEASALVGEEQLAELPKRFIRWLRRIDPVSQSARTISTANRQVFDDFRKALKEDGVKGGVKGGRSDIDTVLLAIADLAEGAPQKTLNQLSSVGNNHAVGQIRDRAHLSLLAHAFERGNFREAGKRAASIQYVDELPPPSRFNIRLAQNVSNPSALLAATKEFADAGIHEALFDAAIASDRATGDGRISAEYLSRLLELKPTSSLRHRTEMLLNLKRRLYGSSN